MGWSSKKASWSLLERGLGMQSVAQRSLGGGSGEMANRLTVEGAKSEWSAQAVRSWTLCVCVWVGGIQDQI